MANSQHSSVLDLLKNPKSNFTIYFLVSVISFSVIGNGFSTLIWTNLTDRVYSLANQEIDKWIIQVIFLILLIILLYALIETPLYSWFMNIIDPSINAKITETPLLTGNFKGLIVAMGVPNNYKPMTVAETAIRHHWRNGNEGHLEHCWLICTDKTMEPAQNLCDKLNNDNIKVEIYYPNTESGDNLNLLIPAEHVDNPAYTQQLIESIFKDAQENKKLKESEIITDLTGGLTSITVGIVLACTPASRRLQYISQVDNQFKEIKISYQLKEDTVSENLD